MQPEQVRSCPHCTAVPLETAQASSKQRSLSEAADAAFKPPPHQTPALDTEYSGTTAEIKQAVDRDALLSTTL
jgi:hypothetical protein